MGDMHKGAFDLPVPVDDGACAHLPGTVLPGIVLASTSGKSVQVGEIDGKFVLYCYPMTGRPDVLLPPGWAEIPGAMGCTPEACAFRDSYTELKGMGFRVFGLSAQSTTDQLESKTRLQLSFELLSDSNLEFAGALNLPTFEVQGRRLIKRLTLIVVDRKVVKVFYPVFPPGAHAEEVVAWLVANLA